LKSGLKMYTVTSTSNAGQKMLSERADGVDERFSRGVVELGRRNSHRAGLPLQSVSKVKRCRDCSWRI
jgi:hypothetical protein